MISKELIRTVLSQTEKTMFDFRDLITDQAHFYIFPFEIQGCVNVTETGIKPESLSVSDVTYFSKVVAGDHPIVATWENSTRWIGKPKRYSFMQCELGAKKHYGVGRYFKGMVTRDAQGLSISNNSSWSGASMAHLQEQTSISITTTTKILKEDNFKLYIIKRYDAQDYFWITPEIETKYLWDKNQIQFLYIANTEHIYSPNGNFMHSRIDFESINDKLADSGYSIANYIQNAYPGSGYAWPRLRLKKGYDPNYPTQNQVEVFVDPLRTIDVGVWGAQIKINNTAIVHSVRLMGYPVLWDPLETERIMMGR